ncbi:unnamed protein product [Phytomonas sp. EM1]|nr:unnamed protein product [Phytomonas sp. EM1]|eukprot:CCW63769.1 unnamed protein product [Phytomonas sp. isolate EM1]
MTQRQDEANGIDVYDKRHLQAKALERWELQKQIWEKTRIGLLTQTARGKRKQGNARVFISSNSYARAKQEDFNMIEASVPRMAMSNQFGWESLLRCTDITQASRYVRIGKGYYPYPLYVEIRDPTAVKKNDFADSRIAFEESKATLGHSLSGYSAVRELMRHKLEGKKLRNMQGSQGNTDGTLDEEVEQFLETGGSSREMDPILFIGSNRTAAKSYHKLLQTHKRCIQKRFGHFFQPRCFMKVEGTPAPRVTVDAAEFGSMNGIETNENPVQYFPPPQRLRLPTPNPNSQVPKFASSGLVGQNDNSAKSLGTATTPSTSISGKLLGRKPEDELSASSPKITCETLTGKAGSSGLNVTLEISTKRVLILARPGELAHGQVTITNHGTVTFFYSWAVADLLMENITMAAERISAQGDSRQLSDVKDKDGAEEKSPDNCSAESVEELNNWRVLHTLAKPAAGAQPSFFLSSSPDGVILPDESAIFAFSVRIPQPGRFQRTYELLTVPSCDANRILVQITALVESGVEMRAKYLARPVAEALEAKVTIDSQRHMVQQIVRNCEPYTAADLESSIYALRCAEDNNASDEKAHLQRQRESWEQHNGLTFDGIPYNKAVFDMLGRVWENLQRTLAELTRASPESVSNDNRDEKAAGEGVGASRFPMGPPPTSPEAQNQSSDGEIVALWESTGGSLVVLLHEIARVRDAPSRNIFYDCTMTLLRAARVSQNEQDPLHELLHRAAEVLVEQIELGRLHWYIREELYQLQRPTVGATTTTKTGSSGGNHPSSAPRSGRKAANLATAFNPDMSGSRGRQPSAGLVPIPAALYEHLLPPEDGEDSSDLREILLSAERVVLIDAFKRRLKAERPARVKVLEQQFLKAIECGARLPLLDVVQKHRADDVVAIQQSELIAVDTSTEAPTVKPVSSSVKGKFRQ